MPKKPTKKGGFRGNPPKPKKTPVFDDVQDFVDSAATNVGAKASIPMPWDGVPPKKKHPYTLRLPESLFRKMTYLKMMTGQSIHEFIMDRITPAVEEELDKLLKSLREEGEE